MTNNAICLPDLDLEFQTKQPINKNAQHFLKTIKEINKLPFNQGNFYFSDNVWDFGPYRKTNIRKSTLKFDFNNVCECFRDDMKFFVLFKILEGNLKTQSVNHAFKILYSFFNSANESHFFKIEDITSAFIKDYFSKFDNNTLAYQLSIKNAVKLFYEYYSANFENLLTDDMLNIIDDIDYRKWEANRNNNKIPDIPQDYFNNFLSAILKIIDDPLQKKEIRATAAFYLILSQTGLRISECAALEIDNLETVSIFNGETAHYLKYKTWKRKHGSNNFDYAITYVNELAKKGYDFLVNIYKENRPQYNTSYLFLGTSKNTIFPLPETNLNRLKHMLFIEINNYFPTVNLSENTYKNIKNITFNDGKYYKKYKHVKTIAEPTNHQFRVHMCTDLYNKGVPLQYIEKFMTHLSHEMADYYVRPTKQNPQENMSFSLDTLQKIVTGDTKLLGGNGGLQAKINEFIKKNKYNVETDLQTICEKLAEDIPIRQKTGGVCIKSSQLRECSKDSKTNEFYCSYGVCPNIFHFYYMADISYRQAKELSETIEINRNRGLTRWVEKETHMLHHIVKVKLIPELDELKNVINKKGVQAVMMEYPDLKDIIENFDEIYKEAEQWLK